MTSPVPVILVVEDYDIAGLLLERFLTRGDASGRSYTVDRVENGRLAVEAAAARRYDLILMDVEMPEMDGIEAVQLIRQDEQRRAVSAVQVIAITANTDAGASERYLQAVYSGYLAKPVVKSSLLEAVARATGMDLDL